MGLNFAELGYSLFLLILVNLKGFMVIADLVSPQDLATPPPPVLPCLYKDPIPFWQGSAIQYSAVQFMTLCLGFRFFLSSLINLFELFESVPITCITVQ